MKLNHSAIIAVAAGVLAGGAHAMRPAEVRCTATTTTDPAEPTETHPDRKLFDRLAGDVRKLDAQYGELMDEAVREAHREGVNLETKARLLSLRDQRDRLHARMLILSARHDWAVPELKTRTVKMPNAKEINESLFGPIDVLVRRRLTLEAAHIAERVPLPVVSVETRSR